jgi:hypothetical protein
VAGEWRRTRFFRPPHFLSREGRQFGPEYFDGPGLANVNLNVVKTAHIPWFVPEGATSQLCGEIFNLFNRVNLTNVTNDLSSPLFGKSTAQSLPRSVTFGIQVAF